MRSRKRAGAGFLRGLATPVALVVGLATLIPIISSTRGEPSPPPTPIGTTLATPVESTPIFGSSSSQMYSLVADLDHNGQPDLVRAGAVLAGGAPTLEVRFGNNELGFGPPVSVSVRDLAANARNIRGIAISDTNDDGFLDVVAASADSLTAGASTLVVWPTSGLGAMGTPSFTGELPESLPVPWSSGGRIEIVDVTGDGIGDVVALAQQFSSAVTIFAGNGNGTYSYARQFATPDNKVVHDFTTGDFNADSIIDLALASLTEGAVYVLHGAADGSFSPAQTMAVGDPNEFIAAPAGRLASGDFDHDGHLDLVVSAGGAAGCGTVNQRCVQFWSGSASGSFTHDPVLRSRVGTTEQFFAGSNATAVGNNATAVGDFDDDGDLDLVLAADSGQFVSIAYGSGNGSFTTTEVAALPSTRFAASNGAAIGAQLSDLNGDGNLDLVTLQRNSSSGVDEYRSYVVAGRGARTFDGVWGTTTPPENPPRTQDGPTVFDVDADGRTDIVRYNSAAKTLDVYRQLPGRSFAPIETFATGTGSNCSPFTVALQTGDFDGDGRTDVLCPRSGAAYQVAFALNRWPAVSTLASVPGTTPSTRHLASAVRDLDGDGRDEIVVVAYEANGWPVRVEVHGIDASSNLVLESSVSLGNHYNAVNFAPALGLALGDFTGDGHLDAAVHLQAHNPSAGDPPSQVKVVKGSASGLTADIVTTTSNRLPSDALHAIDTDSNGTLDLVTWTSGTSGAPQVLLGGGDGTFTDGALAPAVGTIQGAYPAVGDVTGDGIVDLVVTPSNHLYVYAGRGDGTFDTPTDVYFTNLGGGITGLALGDVDGDAHLDAVTVLDGTRISIFSTPGTVVSTQPDLTTTTISAAPHATTGATIEVTWTVQNQGTGPASRGWQDTFWLVGSGRPIRLGTTNWPTDTVLASGASASRSVTLTVPPLTPGEYRIRIDNNTDASLLESSRINNQATTAAATAIDVPLLPRSGELTATLTPENPYFLVRTPAGGDVGALVRLTQGTNLGLYAGDGYVPSRTDYTTRNAADTSLVALPASPKSALTYVLVAANGTLSGPTIATLRAEEPDRDTLEVLSTPNVGAGRVTVELLTVGTVIEPRVGLVSSPGGSYRPAVDVAYGTDRIWATFDLSDISTTSNFDVEVLTLSEGLGESSATALEQDPTFLAMLDDPNVSPAAITAAFPAAGRLEGLRTLVAPNALHVDPDLEPGQLALRLSVPSAVRAGRTFSATLTYQNTGSTDLASPVIVVSAGSADGVLLGLDDDPQVSNRRLLVLGAPRLGPGDRLAPGAAESVRISVRAPIGADYRTIPMAAAVVDETAATEPDWAAVVRQGGVSEDTPIVDADGNPMTFGDLTALARTELGPTWADYADHLRALATLGSPAEPTARSVPRLIELGIARVKTGAALGPAAAAPEGGGPGRSRPGIARPAMPGPRPQVDQNELFPFAQPKDATAQADYGTDDPRNFSSRRAGTFYQALAMASQVGQANIISRDYKWSSEVFGDHLDHWLHGNGEARHYPESDGFSQAIKADTKVQWYFTEGPRTRRDVGTLVQNQAAALECESSMTISDQVIISESSGGIGLDFNLFNAAYGIGKIPEARLNLKLSVTKDDQGAITYSGTAYVTLFDKYTWVYPDEGDEYQNWGRGGLAITEDKNFQAWYLEHYGFTHSFPMRIDLGNFDIAGQIPPGECDEESEEEAPPAPPEAEAPKSGPFEIQNVGATDPNDKQSSGAGNHGAIRPGDQIDYTIRFENIAEATAAAQEVKVTDVLDPRLDLDTFELTNLGFGSLRVEIPPGRTDYQTEVIAPSDPTHPVQIRVQLDRATRTVTWTMRSIDAATGELTTDVHAGFLPPNLAGSGAGEGWVAFSIDHGAGVSDADTWNNQASIVFDVNDPIITNAAPVTIDDARPQANVTPLPQTSPTTFTVGWGGTDTVGPVTNYDVYVVVDGAAPTKWQSATASTTASFSGTVGSTYSFRAVATDAVGRVSDPSPWTTTEVISITNSDPDPDPDPGGPNPGGSGFDPTANWPRPDSLVVVDDRGGVHRPGVDAPLASAPERLNAAPVDVERSLSGGGYYVATADGGLFTSGDAAFYGSLGAVRLNAPIVDIALTPSGRGYWLIAADGGVFAFGDAAFYGSLGGISLNQPIVAGHVTAAGYVLVAADGGVFTFGDALFHGSLGGTRLNAPIVASWATNNGYSLVASDGGVFTFGDALFHGSLGGTRLNAPIVDATAVADGVVLVATDGGIFTLGPVHFPGSLVSRGIRAVAIG